MDDEITPDDLARLFARSFDHMLSPQVRLTPDEERRVLDLLVAEPEWAAIRPFVADTGGRLELVVNLVAGDDQNRNMALLTLCGRCADRWDALRRAAIERKLAVN